MWHCKSNWRFEHFPNANAFQLRIRAIITVTNPRNRHWKWWIFSHLLNKMCPYDMEHLCRNVAFSIVIIISSANANKIMMTVHSWRNNWMRLAWMNYFVCTGDDPALMCMRVCVYCIYKVVQLYIYVYVTGATDFLI